MLSREERIWNRVKAYVACRATTENPIDAARARRIVDHIIWDEHAHSIPGEAREFYAEELRSMASEAE